MKRSEDFKLNEAERIAGFKNQMVGNRMAEDYITHFGIHKAELVKAFPKAVSDVVVLDVEVSAVIVLDSPIKAYIYLNVVYGIGFEYAIEKYEVKAQRLVDGQLTLTDLFDWLDVVLMEELELRFGHKEEPKKEEPLFPCEEIAERQ